MTIGLLFVLVAGCAAAPSKPSATAPGAAPSAPALAPAPGPAMVRIPTGWTDIVTDRREDVEALMPGLYDKAHAMALRDGYLNFAFDLRPDSPDQGSTMTMLTYLPEGVVNEAFLDRFLGHNNLNVGRDQTVDRRILNVRGRTIARWRVAYAGAKDRVNLLVYLFNDDHGAVIELVFTVKADRYEALRPEIEAIETGTIVP